MNDEGGVGMKHQIFESDKELKELFWDKYKQRQRPSKHQFEVQINEDMIDLLVLEEVVEGQPKLNSFVFSMKDIPNAIIRARNNLKYVNKSWIVIPIEKEKVINNRYLPYLNECKKIGVIGLKKPNGFFKRFYSPEEHEFPELKDFALNSLEMVNHEED